MEENGGLRCWWIKDNVTMVLSLFSARVAFVLIIIYCHAWLPYFDHAQAIIFHKFLNHDI